MSEIPQRDYFERRLTDLELRMFDKFMVFDAALSHVNEVLKDHTHRHVSHADFERLEDLVRGIQGDRRRDDGRVLIMSTWISIIVTTVLWAVSRLLR